MVKECVINIHRLCYRPWSGRAPFSVEVHRTNAFKRRHGDDASAQVDVSITWMLKYFHPAILRMAINQYWMPSCFTKAINAGDDKSQFPTFQELDHSLSIQEWKYGDFKKTESVGATPDGQTAGCAREAMKYALECCPLATPDVVKQVVTWNDWVGFPDLGALVQDLNTVCDDGNRHSLLKLNTSKRTLLQSRLGRMRLWKGGFTVVVLRPVLAAAGWDQHCIAMTASTSRD